MSKPEPVGSEELKDAILAKMVERFGDRPTMGLALASFEIKQTALWRRPSEPQERHAHA